MLRAHTISENRSSELAEGNTFLELAEQLRLEETTQKQALKEAFEKEKNKLPDEITMLQKRVTRIKNHMDKVIRRSKFKGLVEELKHFRALK